MTFRPGSDTPEAEPDAQTADGSASSMTATERIIQRFGGIRPMANKLKTPVTTVQGWKKRGAIPLSRHADLRATAAKLRIKLDEADLEAATPAEDRSATEAKAADGKAAPMKTPEEKPAAAKAPDSTKTEPAKTDAAKAAEPKPADTKPVSAAETPKPGEMVKPAEAKPAGAPVPPTSVADTPKTVVTPPPAASGTKPADVKPADAKPVSVADTPKPEASKPVPPPPAKPAEVKPAAPTPIAPASVAGTPKPAVTPPPATSGAKPGDTPKPGTPAATAPAGAKPADTKPAASAAAPAKSEPPKSDAPKSDAPKPEASKPAGSTYSTYTPAPVVVEQRASGAGFATVVSLVALIVGAAALSEPFWSPKVPGWPQPTAAPAPAADPALRAQIQQLAERVGKLEQRPAAAAPSGDTAALTARLDAVEKKVAAQPTASVTTSAAPSGGAADAQVAALAGRLAALEQRPAVDPTQVAAAAKTAGAAAQAAEQVQQEVSGVKGEVASLADTVQKIANAQAQAQSLVLAAGQLGATVASGQPFEAELKTARAVAGSDAAVVQALDTLAPLAGKGVPTRAQLADRFGPLADEIVKADIKGSGATWVDQVTGTLSTLVTVRRQGGGIVGDTAEAVTARAEAAVHQGNLTAAVGELSALTGPAAQAAAGWLADAKARLGADAAGKTLTDRSIALLNAAAKGQAVAQ